MITEPQDQIVFNTLYFQKQLELDPDYGVYNNVPANEYLSKLVNLNMKTFLNTNFNNCILLGFDVVIEDVTNFNIKINILPGLAILDDFLFELNDISTFTFNTEIYKDIIENKKLLISLSKNNSNLVINLNILDKNNNFINNVISTEFLPIKIFDIEFKDTNVNILNLEDNNMLYNSESLIYNLISSLYMNLDYTGNISDIRPKNKLFDFPKKYIINNKNYMIPNYGRHYDFATNLTKVLVNNLSIMNFPVKHVYEIFE